MLQIATDRASSKTTIRARVYRRNPTAAENRLWQALRNRQIEGRKFVRQEPVGPFILDFLCRDIGLVIEVDGATHETPGELAYDQRRTAYLSKLGYRVIRVTNADVLESLDHTIDLIRRELRNNPSPSRA